MKEQNKTKKSAPECLENPGADSNICPASIRNVPVRVPDLWNRNLRVP